jgi:putative zinc finger/helix-turn-helix YgiT family protein
MPAKNQPQPGSRPFPWPCSNCVTRTVVPAVIEYTAKVKHDGVIHELHFPALEVPRCQTCGETVITTAVDEQINEALRAHLRFLTPAQIRKGIETLGLKQQELADRLGVAPETISRWVNGALIQSRAMDNLLRLYFALPEVRDVLRGANQDPRLGVKISTRTGSANDHSSDDDCRGPIKRRMRTRQFDLAVKAHGEDGLQAEIALVRTRHSFFLIGQE